jgi:hypothetical protein
VIKRVYSLETEYALAYDGTGSSPSGTAPSKADLYEKLEAKLLAQGAYAICDPTRRQARRDDDTLVRVREGYFLPQGARLYYDTGHLEWAAPEASDPYQALVYDRAGEVELAAAAAAVEKQLGGGRPLIIKNNLDYQSDVTYGCHENYSVRRRSKTGHDVLMQQLVERLTPFLVTRQILCGAGRLGASCPPYVAFQLSQRADFITDLSSKETRQNRPIVNTRNEPLADSEKFTRLHLILGDSNLAEYPSFLKLGATGILLDMIEADAALPNLTLANPLEALHKVSRDLGFKYRIPLRAGSFETALGIQRAYLQAAWNFVTGPDPLARHVLQVWDGLLLAIERQVAELGLSLDWAIKRRIFGRELQRNGITWEELEKWEPVLARTYQLSLPPARPVSGWANWLRGQLKAEWEAVEAHCRQNKLDLEKYAELRRCASDLRTLDIRYHDIDPRHGLSYQPGESAQMIGQISGSDEAEIETARHRAPQDTRAAIRECVIHLTREHADKVCMDWDYVHLPNPTPDILLPDPLSSDVSVLAAWPAFKHRTASRPEPARGPEPHDAKRGEVPSADKEPHPPNNGLEDFDIDVLGVEPV